MQKDVVAKNYFSKINTVFQDPDQTKSLLNNIKNFALALLKAAILIGVGYVILSPIIGMVVNSFSSNKDAYNPMVFVLPQFPTLERYKLAIERLDYFKTIGKDLLYTLTLTVLELVVCSMVGYGFARFDFPLKKLLFGCVVVMIVIPSHVIMLPVYMTFRNFDPFGIVTAIRGTSGLMGTVAPMYIMTLFGCGVRSGLYIYIFNQFFRGLPKEIEEAALVDGAGVWYTYFRIMLVNAMPAVITVTVFSIVWQFNDTFFAKLFLISEDVVISKKISSLQSTIANMDKILDVTIQELYLDAGIVLVIVPIIIIYCVLQKYFIEGVERSGIVG
ncbi:MAG: carbohydrate ABC transporter permease [Roseburia sp.]|nr:carbohydrate ABC transporter permease [Ruminococcus sp.]MCM1154332.1 carbohydrate ABC transporter permease [Roseburia sp.]MCM1242165.1 carbohydrate ABC transporter permease [Roseburia sp.]